MPARPLAIVEKFDLLLGSLVLAFLLVVIIDGINWSVVQSKLLLREDEQTKESDLSRSKERSDQPSYRGKARQAPNSLLEREWVADGS